MDQFDSYPTKNLSINSNESELLKIVPDVKNGESNGLIKLSEIKQDDSLTARDDPRLDHPADRIILNSVVGAETDVVKDLSHFFQMQVDYPSNSESSPKRQTNSKDLLVTSNIFLNGYSLDHGNSMDTRQEKVTERISGSGQKEASSDINIDARTDQLRKLISEKQGLLEELRGTGVENILSLQLLMSENKRIRKQYKKALSRQDQNEINELKSCQRVLVEQASYIEEQNSFLQAAAVEVENLDREIRDLRRTLVESDALNAMLMYELQQYAADDPDSTKDSIDQPERNERLEEILKSIKPNKLIDPITGMTTPPKFRSVALAQRILSDRDFRLADSSSPVSSQSQYNPSPGQPTNQSLAVTSNSNNSNSSAIPATLSSSPNSYKGEKSIPYLQDRCFSLEQVVVALMNDLTQTHSDPTAFHSPASPKYSNNNYNSDHKDSNDASDTNNLTTLSNPSAPRTPQKAVPAPLHDRLPPPSPSSERNHGDVDDVTQSDLDIHSDLASDRRSEKEEGALVMATDDVKRGSMTISNLYSRIAELETRNRNLVRKLEREAQGRVRLDGIRKKQHLELQSLRKLLAVNGGDGKMRRSSSTQEEVLLSRASSQSSLLSDVPSRHGGQDAKNGFKAVSSFESSSRPSFYRSQSSSATNTTPFLRTPTSDKDPTMDKLVSTPGIGSETLERLLQGWEVQQHFRIRFPKEKKVSVDILSRSLKLLPTKVQSSRVVGEVYEIAKIARLDRGINTSIFSKATVKPDNSRCLSLILADGLSLDLEFKTIEERDDFFDCLFAVLCKVNANFRKTAGAPGEDPGAATNPSSSLYRYRPRGDAEDMEDRDAGAHHYVSPNVKNIGSPASHPSPKTSRVSTLKGGGSISALKAAGVVSRQESGLKELGLLDDEDGDATNSPLDNELSDGPNLNNDSDSQPQKLFRSKSLWSTLSTSRQSVTGVDRTADRAPVTSDVATFNASRRAVMETIVEDSPTSSTANRRSSDLSMGRIYDRDSGDFDAKAMQRAFKGAGADSLYRAYEDKQDDIPVLSKANLILPAPSKTQPLGKIYGPDSAFKSSFDLFRGITPIASSPSPQSTPTSDRSRDGEEKVAANLEIYEGSVDEHGRNVPDAEGGRSKNPRPSASRSMAAELSEFRNRLIRGRKASVTENTSKKSLMSTSSLQKIKEKYSRKNP